MGAYQDARQTDQNGKDHRKRADRPFDEREHEEKSGRCAGVPGWERTVVVVRVRAVPPIYDMRGRPRATGGKSYRIRAQPGNGGRDEHHQCDAPPAPALQRVCNRPKNPAEDGVFRPIAVVTDEAAKGFQMRVRMIVHKSNDEVVEVKRPD